MILLLATGCGAEAPQVKVADILANCDAYRGKPVQAMGYLGQCTFEGCFLAARKGASETFERVWANYQELSRHPEPSYANKKADESLRKFWPLAFKPKDEAGDAFVRKAAPLQYRYVAVTGTISKDGCSDWDTPSHATSIEPTDIRAWTESEGAPAKNSSRR